MPAGRSDGSETLVIMAPFYNANGSTQQMILFVQFFLEKNTCGISVALALGSLFSSIETISLIMMLTSIGKKFWARDITIVIAESGNAGIDQWLFQRQSTESQGKPDFSGVIQGALSFEIDGRYCDTGFDSINISIDGSNGLLPNLDLLNVVNKLAEARYVDVNLGHSVLNWLPSYFSRNEYIAKATGLISMCIQLALGSNMYSHGILLEHHINAVTIRASESKRRENEDIHRFSFKLFYEIIEGTFRSLNNLLESLHQSFFFYVLPDQNYFISIANYLPATVFFSLSMIFKVLPCVCVTDLMCRAYRYWSRLTVR